MTPAPNLDKKPPKGIGSSDLLIWWLIPVGLVILGLAIWSNHFQVQFHADDFPTIVNNRALDTLSNIPRFFTQPRLASSEAEYGDYKPLLTTSFAIDKWLSWSDGASVYQLDTFFWFGLLVFSIYLTFRMIPGTNHWIALFGAVLFGLHPIAAETVNYISQRGSVMAGAGVALALAFWLIWPSRLPKKLGLNLTRVPQNWWQDQVRIYGPSWEQGYRRFLKLPIPFYLIPLVPALFADPSAAVFALILLVIAGLYESELNPGRLILPVVLCGVYAVLQSLVVLTVSPFLRIPLWTYLAWQPWVVMRYLVRFFMPWTITADTGFVAASGVQAFAGLIALAVLIGLVLMAGRRERWRGVAFGIWWFLASLAPSFFVPQRAMEANSRMFLASAGLAFAVAHLGGVLFSLVSARGSDGSLRIAATAGCASVAVAILAVLGWMTYERNAVWQTEKSLWLDVVERDPNNGRGMVMYSAALALEGDDAESYKALQKAVPLCQNDGVLQLILARAFDKLNKDIDTEQHFRRAIALTPVSTAYAWFGQWLFAHQRLPEALEMSKKALALNPLDIISRHTLMDLYAQQSDWVAVKSLAKETLALNPDDPNGMRSMNVASASIDQVHQAEEDAKNTPTVDEYLRLSMLYYQERRFEDCAKAAKEALRLRPTAAEAYANIATAMHALGRDDEAISALREVIRLRPDMAFAKSDLQILLDKKASNVAN